MTGPGTPVERAAERELAAELGLTGPPGAPLPEGIDRLDDEALQRLVRDLRLGKARRVADIDAAIDASLALLPRHFRPAVRRVLGL